MLYLSQLQGAPVEDSSGTRIGKISDLLTIRDDQSQRCAFLIEGQDGQSWYVPADGVVWRDHTLHLSPGAPRLEPAAQALSPRQVALAGEVLDKQVIDLARKKPVRVNDVTLSDDWRVLGVDNSPLGLMRRLAPPWLLGTRSKPTPASIIPWERIELIGSAEEEASGEPSTPPGLPAVTLPRPTSGQLAELHPADIADIVHQLSPGQGARLIEGLDNEIAADAFEEIDTDRQAQILEKISAERAADILEAMGPDEAADLLARLPEELAQELLHLMKPEDSEDVQELLEYEENSAGGLMTTDYIALNASRTVAEALESVRANIREDIRAIYIYCVPDEAQEECPLLGMVSLWDLLAAAPTRHLHELMETDVVAVRTDTEPRTVAEVMAKYNLLAVPVVSPTGILEGVVTVDDALDVLLPNARKRKPRKMY
ncbi:MAG TPA: CBS domain-containing protein [Ktedonobacteraceae bacterium]